MTDLLERIKDEFKLSQQVTITIPRSNRLFFYINDLNIFLSSLSIAANSLSGNSYERHPRNAVFLASGAFPFGLSLYNDGTIEDALADRLPDNISILFRPAGLDTPPDTDKTTRGFVSIMTRVASTIVANFYDEHFPLFETSLGTDVYSWPAIFNFTRVVRNAISHRNRVYFKNPDAPAVLWRQFSYHPKDNGKLLVGGDMFVAELLFLLLEAAKEMNRLKIPNPHLIVT